MASFAWGVDGSGIRHFICEDCGYKFGPLSKKQLFEQKQSCDCTETCNSRFYIDPSLIREFENA